MASAPMDALTSFVYLTDHLPAWIGRINDLATHAATKREEFTAEYKRVLEHARPKRKKTPSVTSLRPDDKPSSLRSHKCDKYAHDIPPLPHPTEISPLEPANKYLFANARRGKRRQGTSFRSGASGLQTFRNQHQVIIYYDSVLQHAFEGLVKDIGTARNNLRKGKQARVLERGLRLPAFGTGNYGQRRRGPMLLSPPKSRPSPDISLEPQILLNDSPPDDDAPFTEAAKDLEAAQALCETAAHQFLRDGDCTLEIDRIRTYFENVLQVAKAQIEALEQEKIASADGNTEHEAATKKENHEVATAVAEKLGMNIKADVNTEAAEIEVDSEDDNNGEDMVIDISRFRAARVNGLRA
jgi:hypothetical protein